jgi:hypothetical protein
MGVCSGPDGSSMALCSAYSCGGNKPGVKHHAVDTGRARLMPGCVCIGLLSWLQLIRQVSATKFCSIQTVPSIKPDQPVSFSSAS